MEEQRKERLIKTLARLMYEHRLLAFDAEAICQSIVDYEEARRIYAEALNMNEEARKDYHKAVNFYK